MERRGGREGEEGRESRERERRRGGEREKEREEEERRRQKERQDGAGSHQLPHPAGDALGRLWPRIEDLGLHGLACRAHHPANEENARASGEFGLVREYLQGRCHEVRRDRSPRQMPFGCGWYGAYEIRSTGNWGNPSEIAGARHQISKSPFRAKRDNARHRRWRNHSAPCLALGPSAGLGRPLRCTIFLHDFARYFEA